MDDCVFCKIVAGKAPAAIVKRWPDATAFVPLGPVVDDHILVVPNAHVDDFMTDPAVTGITALRTAELARGLRADIRPGGKSRLPAANLITSAGAAATQTVFHLHMHIVPRWADEGLPGGHPKLPLPWTPQHEAAKAVLAAKAATRETV